LRGGIENDFPSCQTQGGWKELPHKSAEPAPRSIFLASPVYSVGSVSDPAHSFLG